MASALTLTAVANGRRRRSVATINSNHPESVWQESADPEAETKKEDVGLLKYLKTPESSVYRAPMTFKVCMTSLDTEFLADSDALLS